MKSSFQVVVATLIAALLPGRVFGQVKNNEPVETVRISGRVEDQTAAPFMKMVVLLKIHGLSDIAASSVTDPEGVFAFQVPGNTYDLYFQAPGFTPVVSTVRAVGGSVEVGTVRLHVAPTFGPTVVAGNGKDEKGYALWAAISVPQPIYVEGSETERLQIYFGIYNDGDSAVSPNVELSHLFINGVEPQDWSFVIGSGIRNELFSSLPSGQILQFTYLLGPRYFKQPGTYTVRWQGKSFTSPDLTFRVVPRSR